MALRLVQFLAIILTALALRRPTDLHWMGSLRYCLVRRFGSEFGPHDRAAQAGPIIRLRARLIFVYCC